MSAKGAFYTFLTGRSREEPELDRFKKLIEPVTKFVVARDCLDLSFALDYEKRNGDPETDRTEVGALRYRAKTYGRSPSRSNHEAAGKLAELCAGFIDAVACYQQADGILSVPSSQPSSSFDLPRVVASTVSKLSGIPDLTPALTTARVRPKLQELQVGRKLAALKGTYNVEQGLVAGRTLILLDDLYQSGTSMNSAGMVLQQAGATRIFGLACEKTCTNRDNVREEDQA
jgi:phosphoribosylpyrophosphate synthetase